MNEETRKLLQEAMKHADPALVEKYGNPLDENDPRMWTPSKRLENGVSLEDRVEYLGLDLEAQALVLQNLMIDNANLKEKVYELLAEQLKEQLRTNPEAAVKRVMEMMNGGEAPKGSYGPFDSSPDAGIRYAGSSQGMPPDHEVETPQGLIRADQIPGYRNDPNWRPSPDWVDANCMCPTHVAQREHDAHDNPFGDNGLPGMYL